MMSTLVSCYVVLANAPLIEAFVSKSVNMRLKNWSIHYHCGGLLFVNLERVGYKHVLEMCQARFHKVVSDSFSEFL